MKTAGPQSQTNFFTNATRNRVALVPGALGLAAFANQGNLGQGAGTNFNARVRGSQLNGSGPPTAPITAPFSFTQFATGLRTLVMKRAGRK